MRVDFYSKEVRIFSFGEDSHALRLVSELPDLRAANANLRLLRPEQIRHRFLSTFVDFLMLFSPKTMLSDALVPTVSTESEAVDGQRCGQGKFSSEKPSRDYSKLIPSGD